MWRLLVIPAMSLRSQLIVGQGCLGPGLAQLMIPPILEIKLPSHMQNARRVNPGVQDRGESRLKMV